MITTEELARIRSAAAGRASVRYPRLCRGLEIA